MYTQRKRKKSTPNEAQFLRFARWSIYGFEDGEKKTHTPHQTVNDMNSHFSWLNKANGRNREDVMLSIVQTIFCFDSRAKSARIIGSNPWSSGIKMSQLKSKNIFSSIWMNSLSTQYEIWLNVHVVRFFSAFAVHCSRSLRHTHRLV